MAHGKPRSPLLRAVTSDRAIRYLETRISLSVLCVGFALSVANLAGRLQIYGDALTDALSYASVWITPAIGVAIFLLGMLRNTAGRIIQTLVVFGVACGSALGSVTGDLTSIVFFGMALLIGTQYGLLNFRPRLSTILAVVIYGACLGVGTYTQSRSASLGAVLNLVGAGFIAYLFVVIASLRLREMQDRQSELEFAVAERTKDLREEVDRRRVAEEEARATAERNETLAGDRKVLLRELHHRSKNDLQMILSLMSLRVDKGDRPELEELFRPTQARIRAIALVHEQLDNSERFDAIGLYDYLDNLLNYLQVTHREYPVTIQADIQGDVAVKLESATHIGLLIHELVLCSFNYSFEPGKTGSLKVSVGTLDDNLRISIVDDGAGLPEAIDPATPDQEELAIVSGLVKRLDCDLSYARTSGNAWSLSIPLDTIRRTPVPTAKPS